MLWTTWKEGILVTINIGKRFVFVLVLDPKDALKMQISPKVTTSIQSPVATRPTASTGRAEGALIVAQNAENV